MSTEKIKISIAGSSGMVGGALKQYFEKQSNVELFLYDKGQNVGSMEEINKADYIYVAVPTPDDKEKGCDTSIVEEVISQIQDGKVVIIKSTVTPGTTDKVQAQNPNLKILFNPEFLTEITADQDMSYPDRQIVGYTKESFNVAEDVMHQLPLAPFERIVPANVAELTKYFGNVWFATKVIFANQFYDLCEKLGVDYDLVRDCTAADKRIGRTHLKIWHKGYRGYGDEKVSKCLPKDCKAVIAFGKQLGLSMDLLKVVNKLNEELWEKYGGNLEEDKDTEFTHENNIH